MVNFAVVEEGQCKVANEDGGVSNEENTIAFVLVLQQAGLRNLRAFIARELTSLPILPWNHSSVTCISSGRMPKPERDTSSCTFFPCSLSHLLVLIGAGHDGVLPLQRSVLHGVSSHGLDHVAETVGEENKHVRCPFLKGCPSRKNFT